MTSGSVEGPEAQAGDFLEVGVEGGQDGAGFEGVGGDPDIVEW